MVGVRCRHVTGRSGRSFPRNNGRGWDHTHRESEGWVKVSWGRYILSRLWWRAVHCRHCRIATVDSLQRPAHLHCRLQSLLTTPTSCLHAALIRSTWKFGKAPCIPTGRAGEAWQSAGAPVVARGVVRNLLIRHFMDSGRDLCLVVGPPGVSFRPSSTQMCHASWWHMMLRAGTPTFLPPNQANIGHVLPSPNDPQGAPILILQCRILRVVLQIGRLSSWADQRFAVGGIVECVSLYGIAAGEIDTRTSPIWPLKWVV